MSIMSGGRVKSVQKLSGTIASQSYPQGSTLKTFPLPTFDVVDVDNTFCDNIWWRVVSGTLSQPISVFADVTGVNQVTVLVNNPGVAFTVSLQVGCRVTEYA